MKKGLHVIYFEEVGPRYGDRRGIRKELQSQAEPLSLFLLDELANIGMTYVSVSVCTLTSSNKYNTIINIGEPGMIWYVKYNNTQNFKLRDLTLGRDLS